jgi:IS30 family transposase
VCLRKEPKRETTCSYVEVNKPGEILGIDLLEINKGCWIIVAIDYFTRKIYAKHTRTKEAIKIRTFLEEINSKLKFEKIVSDNGKEFANKLVMDWCASKGIRHKFAIPYYHKSNGRVERANRTIRNALRKTSNQTKTTLSKVVENYNNIVHRGVGFCPNEAMWKKIGMQLGKML